MIDDLKKDEIKLSLRRYVETITEPDRRAGRNMYKCPLCGSGNKSGNNHNGAFSITKDGKSWKCFSCNQSGDIFTLIGLYEGIEDFIDQATRAAEITGIDLNASDSPKEDPKKKALMQCGPRPHISAPLAINARETKTGKYYSYIKECQNAASKTDYFKSRGFDDDVVKRFGLGYDETLRAIVIPYDQTGGYYITRSTIEKKFRKPKSDEVGAEPVYNKAALYDTKPCFVCESPIDAISVIIASGGAVGAISLGGTGSSKLIEQIREKEPTTALILNFDNDEPGRKASMQTAEALSEFNTPFIVASYNLEEYPENQRKDANDLLLADRDKFAEDIKANVSELEKITNAEKITRIEAHNAFRAFNRLKDFSKDITKGFYVPTGFSELDKELDGGFYPGLYVMGAISSLGKTTLLLQIADQIAKSGQDILYFSLEMAATELMSKSISRITFELCEGKENNAKTARGITTGSRYKSYSPDEKQLINKALKQYTSYSKHIYFFEGIGDIGVEEIKSRVAEHIELTGNTPLVFIDYLQILAPYDMRASDKQNTDKAVLELKRLSRDYDTSIIAISSFNRDNYTTEVNMTAFKESGAIEYGSDVLIALQPQGMKPGYSATEQKDNLKIVKSCKTSLKRNIEVCVLKNRSGKTGGKIGFDYRTLFNHFEQNYGYAATAKNNDSGLRV